LDEAAILIELDQLFSEYKLVRTNNETFGDFAHRKYFN
jgi:hypothetical protein